MNPDDYYIDANRMGEDIKEVRKRIFDIIDEKRFDLLAIYIALLEMSETIEQGLARDKTYNFTEDYFRDVRAKAKETIAHDVKLIDKDRKDWQKKNR